MLGSEGAGTVEAVGPDVKNVAPGDRVAYAMARGSYAEYAVVPAWQLVKIPASVDFETAAAAMLQGMTAHYLTHSTYPLKPGDSCLIHAAAGGTGRLIVQMAKMLGAHVIGTVGSRGESQASQRSRRRRSDHLHPGGFRRQGQGRARGLRFGRPVHLHEKPGLPAPARHDGKLRKCQRRGHEFSPLILSQKGSLFLTRPTLANYTATAEELDWRATDVLNWIGQGKLKLHIHKVYPLADASEAQRDLEGRKTTGKLLLRVA